MLVQGQLNDTSQTQTLIHLLAISITIVNNNNNLNVHHLMWQATTVNQLDWVCSQSMRTDPALLMAGRLDRM